MGWKWIQQLLARGAIAGGAGYVALFAALAAAAGVNPTAKDWLNNQITMWAAILKAEYLALWAIGLPVLWAAAYCLAGYLAEKSEEAKKLAAYRASFQSIMEGSDGRIEMDGGDASTEA